MDNKSVFSIKNIGIIIISVVSLAVLIFGFVKATSGNNKETKASSSIISEFNEKMKSKTKQVIYFGSATCGYCKLQTPIMKQLKSDYKLSYYYIDASKLNSKDKDKILKALEIEGSTPTIAIVKNNKIIDVNVGYMEGKEAVEFFKKNKLLEDDATYKPEENLTDISFDDYKNLVGQDSKNVIVIGQTTCSHCIAVKPVLNRIAGNNNITINYLNLTKMTQEEQKELIENLKSIGYEDADNLGTPLTLIVQNNKIEGTIEGENPPSYFTREFKKYGVISQ